MKKDLKNESNNISVIFGTNYDLIRSAFRGDFQSVAGLLAGGVEVNFQDPYSGMTCLHIACATGNREIVDVLMDHHKRTGTVNFLLKTRTKPRLAWQLAIAGHHYDVAEMVDRWSQTGKPQVTR